jgi:hypothetical protein
MHSRLPSTHARCLAIGILQATPESKPTPGRDFWHGIFIASGIGVAVYIVAFYFLGLLP